MIAQQKCLQLLPANESLVFSQFLLLAKELTNGAVRVTLLKMWALHSRISIPREAVKNAESRAHPHCWIKMYVLIRSSGDSYAHYHLRSICSGGQKVSSGECEGSSRAGRWLSTSCLSSFQPSVRVSTGYISLLSGAATFSSFCGFWLIAASEDVPHFDQG